MDRAEQLKELFKGVDENREKIIAPLIDEVVFLEKQIQEVKKYPLIKIHPQNPNLQKITAAGKQYREYLQTYTNMVDKLCRIYGKEEGADSSPLRAYFEKLQAGEQ